MFGNKNLDGLNNEQVWAILHTIVLTQLGYIDLRNQAGFTLVYKENHVEAVYENLDSVIVTPVAMDDKKLQKGLKSLFNDFTYIKDSRLLSLFDRGLSTVFEKGELNPKNPEVPNIGLVQLDFESAYRLCAARLAACSMLALKDTQKGEVMLGVMFTKTMAISYNYTKSGEVVLQSELDSLKRNGVSNVDWLARKLTERGFGNNMPNLIRELERLINLSGGNASLGAVRDMCVKDLGWSEE